MKKKSIFILGLLVVLLGMVMVVSAESPSDVEAPAASSNAAELTFLVVGKAETGEDEMTGAILCTMDTSSHTFKLAYYPGDTVVNKGGTYKTHLYGGPLSIHALYKLAYTWDGPAAVSEVMKQVFLANWDISVHEVVELTPEDFAKVHDTFEAQKLLEATP